MSRDLAAVISTALQGSEINVFWACDLLFDSPNDIYLWNGIGDLLLDGKTYTGVGDLLGVSEIKESSDIAAYGAQLSLSGIPSDTISTALNEPYQGRHAIVKFGVISGGTHTAFTVFSGEMDQMTINYGPETVTISLDVESRLVDLERARVRRYTDADQQLRYNGDLAFEFVTRLQEESLQWAG